VLLLQALVFMAAINVVSGAESAGFLDAFIGSFVYAIINTVLVAVLAIDSGESFYGLLVQQLLLNAGGAAVGPARTRDHPGGRPGHPILAGRVRAGSVNTMARWIREGSHRLSRWEAILPSMTSASQAGILHGNTTASRPSAGTSATAGTSWCPATRMTPPRSCAASPTARDSCPTTGPASATS